MKQIFILLLFTLSCASTVYADRITSYDVTIQNPKNHSVDSLTIIVKMEFNAETIETYKYVWKGESFKDYEMGNDGKWHYGKSGHTEWFTAYHRPHKNGYIVIKNISGFEEFGIEKIILRDSNHNTVKIQEKPIPASTNHMFWTQDGKQLVIMYDETPIDNFHEDTAKFYSAYNGKLVFSKPAKEVNKEKMIPIKDVKL